MEQLHTISHLFTTFDSVTLLKKISDIGVIAGGSVVHALCDTLCDDVDIFINSLDMFREVYKLIKDTGKIDGHYTPHLSEDNKTSVLTITLVYETHPFQIILMKYEKPEEVINSFDLDYVCCGIHKGKLLMTDDCRKAHETMTITKYRDIDFRFGRLIKAAKKGFRCPVISSDLSCKRNQHEFDHFSIDYLDGALKFINSDYVGKNLDKLQNFSDIKIVGLESNANSHKNYGEFILDLGNGQLITKRYVSIEADIVNFNEWYIDISDDYINRLFCKLKHKLPLDRLKTGKHTIIISGYKSYNNIYAKVVGICDNAIGLDFDNGFYIKGEGITIIQRYDNYSRIWGEISKLKSTIENCQDDEIRFMCKKRQEAYETFVNEIKRFEYKTIGDKCRKITNAINAACRKIDPDINETVETVDEMIDFINGFDNLSIKIEI